MAITISSPASAGKEYRRFRGAEPLSVHELLARLESVRRAGEGRWLARCPAHGDRGPSLSIREGKDGRLLVHCFAGCKTEEVVSSLGLEMWQLFPPGDLPWTPKLARPDPLSETLEAYQRLKAKFRPPGPGRMRDELRLIGGLLLGGTRAFLGLPEKLRSEHLQAFPLRLIYQAMEELARQKIPRRWFSPLALSRELDAAAGPGCAAEYRLSMWARVAIKVARKACK